MDNKTVGSVFSEIAELLEMKGENAFKVRAYRRAAESVERYQENVVEVMHEGRLTDIPGVGEGIARRIQELVMTGRLAYREELRAEFPEGVRRLLEISGIGPKTAGRLSRELGVGSIDDLEVAIGNGRVAALPRLGEKAAERLLAAIEVTRRRDTRTPIGYAWPIAKEFMAMIRRLPGVVEISAGGSLRRMRETLGDVDIVGSSTDIEDTIDAFVRLPFVTAINSRELQTVCALTAGGVEVEFRLGDPASFGALLQRHTGSKRHNALIDQRAAGLGLRLTEEGVVRYGGGGPERFATEDELYSRLGLQFIPPELREGMGEIEAAATGSLPSLLGAVDIKGNLHTHSLWSDGLDTIETMSVAAQSRGYQYLAMTDHSGGLGVAHGLSVARVREQIEEIKGLNQRLSGIRLLTGIEVDIRVDGSLDLPDDLLADLDIVVASIHSAMGQDEEKMTQRLLRAIANPNVDIIGHPTCRIVGGREPIRMGIDAVFRAAAAAGTAMEINAAPMRLDLKDDLVRRARDLGVKVAIGTDAHNVDHLDFMHFGVGVARRGWCGTEDVVNAWPLEKVLAFAKNGTGETGLS
ncbi:MAG: DNA polymerase/3'-5' exonuclease PolX [Dehalococcoidia bacterium]|nr:DNA polymerase/3'-5' exonuclease PolX [Dehalococcoidia bacterium]